MSTRSSFRKTESTSDEGGVSAAISVVDVEAIVEKAVKAAVQVVKDEFSNSWKVYKIIAHCWKNELRP